MTSIAVIILNWKQPQLTVNLVRSFSQINHRGFKYHLFVVDNGSTDNSLEIFKKEITSLSTVTILPLKHNYGYAGGNNRGIKKALSQKYDYILLLNNDVLLDPDFLVNLLDFAKNNPSLGAVCPKIYFAPGYEFHHDRYSRKEIGRVIWSVGSVMDWGNIIGSNLGIDEVDHGQYDSPRIDLASATGCCLLLDSQVFKKTGLLSEDYFLYYEDNDFSEQIIRHGYSIGYQPKSVVWHLNSGSSTANKGNLHDYFLTRNRLIFGSKFATFRTRLALFRESLRTLATGRQWQKYGVIDFYLRRFGRGRWQ